MLFIVTAGALTVLSCLIVDCIAVKRVKSGENGNKERGSMHSALTPSLINIYLIDDKKAPSTLTIYVLVFSLYSDG